MTCLCVLTFHDLADPSTVSLDDNSTCPKYDHLSYFPHLASIWPEADNKCKQMGLRSMKQPHSKYGYTLDE